MIPYARSLVFDKSLGIVKAEAVYDLKQNDVDSVGYNVTKDFDWLISPGGDGGNFFGDTPRSLFLNKTLQKPETTKRNSHTRKKNRKRTGKKKCIVKFMEKGGKMKRRRKGKYKFYKKFMMPMILGLLVAKSVLVPVALKALAFISAKGFLMGFFSTILASFLSLKGMFDHSHRYADRKDDQKTQVEIIQVPSKDEHYYDDHYRRADYPIAIPVLEQYGSRN